MTDQTAESVNPYAVPVDAIRPDGIVVPLPAEDAEIELPARQLKQQWVLRGFGDILQFQNEADETYEIVRGRDPLFSGLMHGLIIKNSMKAKLGGKPHVFALAADDFEQLRDWIGRPGKLDLKLALKEFLAWGVPIGVLFIIMSSLGFDPEHPIKSALDVAFGIGMVGASVCAKYRPGRYLFLAAAACFSILTYYNVSQLVETVSWWSVVFLLICLNATLNAIRAYRRYHDVVDDNPVVTPA